jgi:predicted transcriptional regulator
MLHPGKRLETNILLVHDPKAPDARDRDSGAPGQPEQRRRLIVRHVTASPGIHLGALSRSTNIAEGALRHHLRRLESTGQVLAIDDAGHRGFFLPSRAARRAPRAGPTPERILRAVRENPGITQSLLADRVGTSRTALWYHLQPLIGDGLVRVTQAGRFRYFRVAPWAGESLRS